ncbi:hypothetical protein ACFFQF_08260 [Haladaptatus pallidirubidus]|nr:hypothetical protein [Haladaptatus pallidirubidus]
MLRELLVKAQDGRIAFDRSWRFQFSDRPDLMVEITYLEKRDMSS